MVMQSLSSDILLRRNRGATGHRVFDVLNFEFDRLLEQTTVKKSQVEELAAALQAIFG